MQFDVSEGCHPFAKVSFRAANRHNISVAAVAEYSGFSVFRLQKWSSGNALPTEQDLSWLRDCIADLIEQNRQENTVKQT